MTTVHRPKNYEAMVMRHLYTLAVMLFVAVLLGSTPDAARAQSGKLAGTITDSTSGEPLPGVNVRLVGTNQGAAANANGEYSIIGITPGNYSVRFSLVGYGTRVVQSVRITSDRTRRLDVALSEQTVGLEEVVVEAVEPVVEPTQTASRTVYTSESIEDLPVSDLQEIVSNTSKSFEGFVRGSRRFGTKTVIEGIDVSDSYARASSIERNTRAGYGSTIRTDEVSSSQVNISAGAIEEVSVNTGATQVSAPSGSGGLVNITLDEGRGPIGGSAEFRIAPSINIPGPDSLAFYPDSEVESFFSERETRLTEGSPLDSLAALDYVWSRDKYDVAEDPAMDFTFSLGGEITDNLRFSSSGRFFQSDGFAPNEFNRRVNGTLKITYDLSDNTSLTGIGILQDNGLWGGWNNRNYSELWRYYLEGTAQDDGGSYVGSLRLRQVLSENSFLTVQAYRTYSRTRYGFPDDDGDGLTEPGENGDFINLLQTENIEKYNWIGNDLGDDGLTEDQEKVAKMFYGGPFPPERSPNVLQPSGEPIRAGGPMPYYEDAQRATNAIKVDYSNQITPNHLIEVGTSLELNTVDYKEARAELYEFNYTLFNPSSDPDLNDDGVLDVEPYAPSIWERNPYTLSFYASDRIEYGDLIVNLGLRTEIVDRDTEQIRDYFFPFRRDTVMFNGRFVPRNFFRRGEEVPIDVFWQPRVGVSHPISERAAAYFSYSRSEQLVPYATLYDFYDGNHSSNQFLQFQDPAQEPIVSNDYELGIQWEFLPGWGLDANAYARDIENYGRQRLRASQRVPTAEESPDLTDDQRTSLGFGRIVYETSAGYAEVRGLELQVQRRPFEIGEGFGLSLTGSYTFSTVTKENQTSNQTRFSADQFEDNQLPFDRIENFNNYPQEVEGGNSTISAGYNRRHRALLRAVGALPYGFSIGLDGRYESGFLFPRAINADPRDRELLTAPANFRIDLRLEKKFDLFSTVGADLFIDIENLTNRDNIVAYNTAAPDAAADFQRNGNPGQRPILLDGSSLYGTARNFYFGTRIRF